MDIASGVTFEMEAKEIEKNTLTVGKYIFSKVAFNRAKIILMHAPLSEDGWLVIDEIGPLELKGEGFSETLKSILQFLGRKIKILLVVRDTLSEEVKTYFEIPEAEEILIS